MSAVALLDAREVAAQVTDPEMPILTLADLGVLREVDRDGDRVTVTITPTYSGCPAMQTMHDDIVNFVLQPGGTNNIATHQQTQQHDNSDQSSNIKNQRKEQVKRPYHHLDY